MINGPVQDVSVRGGAGGDGVNSPRVRDGGGIVLEPTPHWRYPTSLSCSLLRNSLTSATPEFVVEHRLTGINWWNDPTRKVGPPAVQPPVVVTVRGIPGDVPPHPTVSTLSHLQAYLTFYRFLRDKTVTDDDFLELCKLRRGAATYSLPALLDLPHSYDLQSVMIYDMRSEDNGSVESLESPISNTFQEI
ncbi:hypothetical protein J6590_002448 [Homalodisca vitripennis]|nr:hypothetical protein J6590_002448 [Homalodisca vitripennis]